MLRGHRSSSLVVVGLFGVAALAVAGCSHREPTPKDQAATSAEATQILSVVRARGGSPLPTGLADGFQTVPGGLRPTFPAAGEKAPARVLFPPQATAPVHVEDASTQTAVDVSLKDARAVAAETAGGYVVYRNAHASGATVLHRALPTGTEDFVSFESRPRLPEVAYQLALGKGVSGLRLVAGTLEMLDAGGAPRLRVEPPYVVGADGARTDATLAVEGCAVDASAAAPWGRPVTAPGATTCTLRVSWDDGAVAYPAVLDPRWTTTGSMTTARQGHTATLLSTGNVLVVGGTSNGTTALASAELYNRTTGTWAATASLTGARTLHSATQLNTSSNSTTSGKVLIAGGVNGTTSQTTAQLYSPTAGTWVAAGNLNAARHAHTATLLTDGRVLVAGGLNGTTILASAALYNPASGAGSWVATTGPIPPGGLKAHTATLILTSNTQLNNHVLLVGGNNGSATVATVFLFDPVQSAFSTLQSIPSAREGHTATTLANGNILVTGGKSGSTALATTILFNPSFSMGSWTSAGNMTTARLGQTATLLQSGIVSNGQVLVAGGSNGSSTLSSTELWNGTSTWTATSAMLAPVQGQTATLLPNSSVLIAGGVNGSTTVGAAELYDGSFGLGCTSNSQCGSGFCVSGVCCNTACTDQCSACNLTGLVGTCSPKTNGTACNDSNACTNGETCQAGACSGGSAVTCTGADTCHTVGACVPATGCPAPVAKTNGTACNDSNACTTGETCQAGACTGGTTVTCTAADQCHTEGACVPATGCPAPVAKTNGTTCSDGNACTAGDTCQAGACTSGTTVTCSGADQCHTVGACVPATGCPAPIAKTNGTACNDSNACTNGETCQAGACTGGTAVTCSGADTCHTVGACVPATGCPAAVAKADGTTCNDGNACTTADACHSGTCSGNTVTCTAQDACHVAGTCNPADGTCSNPNAANGTTCNDNNACTQADSCQAGACTGSPVTCVAQDQCHAVGTCIQSTGLCSNPTKSDGTTCDDGNSCTSGDTCHTGSCTGTQTCASVTFVPALGAVLTIPQLGTTLTTSQTTPLVPGDVAAFSATVTNTGIFFEESASVQITNNGATPFTIGSYQQTIDYFAVATQAWITLGKVSFDSTDAKILDPTLTALDTGGSFFGLTIAPGATLPVSYALFANFPGDETGILFNPALASQIRSEAHFDTGANTPGVTFDQDITATFLENSGTITGTTVALRFTGDGPETDGTLTAPVTTLEPGESASFTGSLPSPAIGPRAAGENSGAYTHRLFIDTFLSFGGTAVANGHGEPFDPPQVTSGIPLPWQFPLLGAVKSGPAQGIAGLTLPYTVQLQNTGAAAASSLAIVDTVGGADVGAQVVVPPTIASLATGTATVNAATPLGQTPGPVTDIASVTWKDRNGNPYGPVDSNGFTIGITAGHPEGYLTLSVPLPGSPQPLGTPLTLTATALDSLGHPAPGVTVHLAITGINAQTADIVTGADGTAAFSYNGPGLGQDHAILTATINGPAIQSNTVGITWVTEAGPPCTGRTTPLDVVLIVDGSPSMLTDDEVGTAQAAADSLINDLNFSEDQVGAVFFSGGAELDAPLTNDATLAKSEIDTSIYNFTHLCDAICPGGSNFAAAFDVALAELQGPRHRPGASPLLIFISDGGNTGVDPSPEIAQIKAAGIRTIAVGLGATINVDLMRQIASSSNDYFYAPTATELSWVYANVAGDACRANSPPLVSAGDNQGLYSVRLPDSLTLQGEAHGSGPQGDLRLTTSWTQLSGPAPVTFTDASTPVTDALFTEPGTYVLQLEASDGILTTADRATITVDPAPSLTGANLAVSLSSPGPLVTGTSETLTAILTDAQTHPISDFTVQVTVAGANPTAGTLTTDANGRVSFSYVGALAGLDALQATALGATAQVQSAQLTVNWVASTNGTVVTQGWIAGPAQQATVMGLVPVTLTGVTLTSGTVSYWPMASPGDVHTIATGIHAGPGATVATFDTTTLANGSYVIDLNGTDTQGNQQDNEIAVTVAGDYKPGRMVLEITDFTVPVAGIPITIGRRYDSLEKDKVGDFGNGWSLAISHPDLQTDPAHNVTLTLPNGRRVTFYFTPTSYPFPFRFLFAPTYTPEAGVFGSLTSDGCSLIVPNGGELDCFEEAATAYVPTTYKYTDAYGVVYTLGADGTLKSIQDRNNNTLTFAANGIVSTASGLTVQFIRDDQGRITQIVTPEFFINGVGDVNQYGYNYDGDGNLTTVVAVNFGPTMYTYTYDGTHRLLTSTDLIGNPARTSTYDDNNRLASDTDAMGNVTRYAYDVAGHTTTTTNPDHGVMTQTFDDRGLLLSQTDPLGRTTTHVYDANRNETTRTNRLGEATHYTYDALGNQTSSVNALGETRLTTYNRFSQPLTRTNPIGNTTTIAYDDTGRPVSFADTLGPLATFTSSEHGLPTSITDAAGNTAYLNYDATGNLTSRTDRLGRVTQYVYDGIGRKTAMIDPRGGVTSYRPTIFFGYLDEVIDPTGVATLTGHDNAGNLTEFSGAPGTHRIYSNKYDALNHLTRTINDFDGTSKTYTSDFRGNRLSETDERGGTTSYIYDLAGQLVQTTNADGTLTALGYDDLGRIVSKTDERSNTTTYAYEAGCDCFDRMTSTTDPLGRTTATTFDALGRRTSIADAAGHATFFAYDVRGHLLETDYADGTATHDTYDALGRRVASRDQTAATTQYGYDAEGHLTAVTDALGDTTQYAHDLNGNLASVADANNHVTTYAYDGDNRKIQRTLPLGMSETSTYDVDGNLATHTDFRGKTTTYNYDNRNLLAAKIPDPTLGEPTVSYTSNTNGTRASMVDVSGTTTYGYDARHRLVMKSAPAGTLTYTYDASGNVTAIRSSNPNGTSVDYDWDPADELASVTDNQAGGVTATTYTTTGRAALVAEANGLRATYAYDALDRVTSLAWQQGTASPVEKWSYTHNQRGQRVTATDVTGRQAAYGYDALSRLASETVTGDPRGAMGNGAIVYSLDPAGNRVSRASTLASLTSQDFTCDANDQLTVDSYDPNGNTTHTEGDTYAYDFENHLISKNGGAVKIVYDGDGNRVAKTAGGLTTQYLVDDLNPTGYLQVLEELSAGAVQTRYTYGNALVSQIQSIPTSPVKSIYGYDAHGNVTFLTDATGTVTDRYDYDAWGNLVGKTGVTPNTRLYAGEEVDPDLGLINLRARAYKPNTGRFLTSDPVMGKVTQPRSWNRYLYASGDPVGRIDPRGTEDLVFEAVAIEVTTDIVIAVEEDVVYVYEEELIETIGASEPPNIDALVREGDDCGRAAETWFKGCDKYFATTIGKALCDAIGIGLYFACLLTMGGSFGGPPGIGPG